MALVDEDCRQLEEVKRREPIESLHLI